MHKPKVFIQLHFTKPCSLPALLRGQADTTAATQGISGLTHNWELRHWYVEKFIIISCGKALWKQSIIRIVPYIACQDKSKYYFHWERQNQNHFLPFLPLGNSPVSKRFQVCSLPTEESATVWSISGAPVVTASLRFPPPTVTQNKQQGLPKSPHVNAVSCIILQDPAVQKT